MSKIRNKRVALYLRVSTGEQTTENQRRELEAVAKQRGWQIVAVYEDKGVSGAKGRDKRPQFDAMLKDAVRGQFDVLAEWSRDVDVQTLLPNAPYLTARTNRMLEPGLACAAPVNIAREELHNMQTERDDGPPIRGDNRRPVSSLGISPYSPSMARRHPKHARSSPFGSPLQAV